MKTKKLNIFVVDDSSFALETIKNVLQHSIEDCYIEAFSTAEECIKRLEDETPDVILSDYYLDPLYEHKMNGDEMLARIKIKHPEIPVIMYSSKNTVEIVRRLMLLGAEDFIPKEKNFLKVVKNVTLRQISKIKTHYDEKIGVRIFFMLLFILSAIWAVIGFYIPTILTYVIIGLFILAVVIAIIDERKSQIRKSPEKAPKMFHPES